MSLATIIILNLNESGSQMARLDQPNLLPLEN